MDINSKICDSMGSEIKKVLCDRHVLGKSTKITNDQYVLILEEGGKPEYSEKKYRRDQL